MCSDAEANAHLDTVLGGLDEERMLQLIDDPVHEATSFVLEGPLPEPTAEGLQQLVTQFVGLVHSRGWGLQRRPTDADCFAVGIGWLRANYTSSASTGYAAALADVVALGTEAFTGVVVALGVAARASQRGSYSRWILCRHIRCLDWEQKRELVRAYLTRFRDGLPLSVIGLPLDVLAGRVEELMELEIGSRSELIGATRSAAVLSVFWNWARDLPASFAETRGGPGHGPPQEDMSANVRAVGLG